METRRLLGLTFVMIVYLCVGAGVFNALEGSNEIVRKEELEAEVDRFLGNNSCVSRQALYKLLFQASRDGELVYYILHNKSHLDRWDFSGALGFSISVVTTIGFGNMSPHTMEGKILVVIYALIGIPLMLLVLAGIGARLMLLFKRIYKFNGSCNNPRANRAFNAGLIILLGLLLGFIVPATVFHFIEDWHFMEALYFCFTTLSTIGFGDYIIGIHEQRISEGALHETYEVVSYVWVLFGLAYVSLVIKYISDILVSKAQKMEQKTVRRLEGTRFFRRNGSKFDDAVSTTPNTVCGVVDMPPPQYRLPDLDDCLALPVQAEMGRINRDIRKTDDEIQPAVYNSKTNDSVSVDNGTAGVELIRVNYI